MNVQEGVRKGQEMILHLSVISLLSVLPNAGRWQRCKEGRQGRKEEMSQAGPCCAFEGMTDNLKAGSLCICIL